MTLQPTTSGKVRAYRTRSSRDGTPSHALCTETGRPRQGPAAMVSRRHGREGRSRNPCSSPARSRDALSTTRPEVGEDAGNARRVDGGEGARPTGRLDDASPAQDGQDALTFLERVGQRAKDKKEDRFNNLLSHIKVPLLKEAYQRLRKDAAPGVDGVTWSEYGENLDARSLDLQDRVHRGELSPAAGSARAHPERRWPHATARHSVAGGQDCPAGGAHGVLEPIYEREFLGFSYGFRPGRSPHKALDALAVAIGRKVDWVLDADIRAFFDTIDHAWMQKFIEHKIPRTHGWCGC